MSDEPVVKCEKLRKVVQRSQDGTKQTVYKCAHQGSITYQQVIAENVCANCVLQQMWPCGCGANKPQSPVYKQPISGPNNEIIFEKNDSPPPPCPVGFKVTDDPWVFASEWPVCPALQFANELLPTGELKINTRCDILRKLTNFSECHKCQGDLKKIAPKEYPSLLRQASNYGKAVVRWIEQNRPTRTDEEVKHIHETYCANKLSPCDWYDAEQERCKDCGCKVRSEGAALLNKIKMGSEHCPKGLW